MNVLAQMRYGNASRFGTLLRFGENESSQENGVGLLDHVDCGLEETTPSLLRVSPFSDQLIGIVSLH